MKSALVMVVRDLAILAGTLWLWSLSRELDAAATDWSVPVAILVGVMTAVCGFVLHEWGHLVGAWIGRSHVRVADKPWSLFLFNYDTGNTREQFLWMSMGGFIVSGFVVAGLLIWLTPTRLADGVALGLTALGVIATIILEFPPAWRVYRGGKIPTGAVYYSEK